MAQPKDPSEMTRLAQLLKPATLVRREPSSHLEPENSPFSSTGGAAISSYEVMVARALVEPMELQVRGQGCREIASLVCLPSFKPEWAVWVAGDRKTGFSVLLTEAGENIWYRALRAEMPLSSAVRMQHGRLPIDRAEAICDIWRRILSQTRYPKESRMGNDGVVYHFAYWVVGNPAQSGKTWSPGMTTVPGKLAALGHSIKDYVQDPENQDVFLNVIDDHLAWFLLNPADL